MNLYRVDAVMTEVFVDVSVIVPPPGEKSVICAVIDAGNSLEFMEDIAQFAAAVADTAVYVI
jgi:hypothetical protein